MKIFIGPLCIVLFLLAALATPFIEAAIPDAHGGAYSGGDDNAGTNQLQ